MAFFTWGNSEPDRKLSRHEVVHKKAYEGERIPHRLVSRGGELVVEGRAGGGGKDITARAAVALYAGYLAGGGDAGGDRKAAEDLAKEAGISMAEVARRARRYL